MRAQLHVFILFGNCEINKYILKKEKWYRRHFQQSYLHIILYLFPPFNHIIMFENMFKTIFGHDTQKFTSMALKIVNWGI